MTTTPTKTVTAYRERVPRDAARHAPTPSLTREARGNATPADSRTVCPAAAAPSARSSVPI